MELQSLLARYEERVQGPNWLPFAGYVDEFLAELATAVSIEVDQKVLGEAQRVLQADYLENRNRPLFQRLVAAELIAVAVTFPKRLRSVVDLLDREGQVTPDDVSVVASLSAHLLSPVAETIGTHLLPFTQEVVTEIRFALARHLERRYQSGTPLSPPQFEAIRTLPGLLPGDCVFRRQTKPWYGNPFQDFGHAGIYVGCIDPAVDANDCSNHQVIHVVRATPACQITSLTEFCVPQGKREQFWGAYQVHLSNSARNRLLQEAFSLVGRCAYSFTHGYKNPTGQSFRCDGFVEHCYEVARSGRSPLSYRGGLCEEDDWKTLNPRMLRSCLTKKIADTIAPCCMP